MTKYYLDTNFLLRFLLDDVKSQYEIARNYFDKAKEKKIELTICQAIIFELVYVLEKYYKVQKVEVATTLGKIISIPYLIIEDQKEFVEAIIMYNQSNTSLIDCFLVTKAEKAGAEVLSFDKEVIKKAVEKGG